MQAIYLCRFWASTNALKNTPNEPSRARVSNRISSCAFELKDSNPKLIGQSMWLKRGPNKQLGLRIVCSGIES